MIQDYRVKLYSIERMRLRMLSGFMEMFFMKRNALIIGNSDYLYFRQIRSCVCDADVMESDFNTLLFNKVICCKNLVTSAMRDTIDDFSTNYECDSLNVIYFSGHGFNINGEDYIVATNANTSNPELNSLSIRSIIGKYTGVHAYVILIVDACRIFDGDVSRNFCGTNMQKDVMIAYSTQIGKEAFGSTGKKLSPFTSAIHSNILKTNLTINSLFQKVRGQLNNDKYVQMSCEISTMAQEIPLTYDYVDKTDEDIYNFVMSSQNGSSLEAAIKASELFNRGYIDIMYSFQKVQRKQLFQWKCPIYLAEAESKSLEFKNLTEMSTVKCVNHRFYYKDKEIRIGDIPLLPSSLSYQKPLKALNVSIKIFARRNSGKIEIIIHSNLPVGFTLIVTFPNKCTFSRYVPVTGKDTIIEMDEIDIGVENDSFVIDISSVSILESSNLVPVVGKYGRNLTGNFIEFSSIWGNQVQFQKNIVLQER